MSKQLLPAVMVTDAVAVKEHAMGGGLEGAERTSRETINWNPVLMSPDMQINPRKDMADLRALDSVQNDGYATGVVNTHRDSIVGAQYRLNAQPNETLLDATSGWSDEFQEVTETRFNLLMDAAPCYIDASRANTLTGLLRLAIGGFLMTGEVFGTVEWMRGKDAIGRPFKTAIQLISSMRLSNPNGEPDTPFLRRGVARNMYGAATGYHIRKTHPAEWAEPENMTWKYVPAALPWGRLQVIHIIEALQPDQTRGISDMVAVLKQMRMTKQFQDVTLQNAVIQASYAASIESELPSDVVFASLGAGGDGLVKLLGQYMDAMNAYSAGATNLQIDGAKIPHLFPGTKMNLKPLGTPGGVGSTYEMSLQRHIASALGLSYEQFSRDYTHTNYSSARASMAETWKYMQSRKKIVADRLAKIIYTLWLEEEINAGNVPLPRGKTKDIFYNPITREALLNCDWIGASRGQIDEMKETQSAILRMGAGLSTLEAESARLGDDWRRTLKQLAREKALAEKLGLDFTQKTDKPNAESQQQNAKEDQ